MRLFNARLPGPSAGAVSLELPWTDTVTSTGSGASSCSARYARSSAMSTIRMESVLTVKVGTTMAGPGPVDPSVDTDSRAPVVVATGWGASRGFSDSRSTSWCG